MIEISCANADLVCVLSNASHFLEVDLLYAVRVVVVILMQSRRQKNDRNALGRIAVMIATVINLLEVSRVVHLIIELQWFSQIRVCVDGDVVKLGADPVRADHVYGV